MATTNQINLGLSGSTGTVNFVGSTSPTIITPKIAQINDTNGNAELNFTTTASAVNGFTITNAATGVWPTLSGTGTDTDIGLKFKVKGAGYTQFLDTSGNITLQIVPGGAGPDVNYFNILSNIAGSPPYISISGSDTNIDFRMVTKGTGVFRFEGDNPRINYITMTPAATTASPTFTFTGSDTNIIGTLTAKGTGGITIQGTTAADNAAAGYVGELLSSANATAIAMTSATITQIQSLTLTPGDWDVWGTFYTTVGGITTQSLLTVQLHPTTATFASPTTAQLASRTDHTNTITTGVASFVNTGISRWNVSVNTSVFLNARQTYAVSTLTGNGMIHARRRR